MSPGSNECRQIQLSLVDRCGRMERYIVGEHQLRLNLVKHRPFFRALHLFRQTQVVQNGLCLLFAVRFFRVFSLTNGKLFLK